MIKTKKTIVLGITGSIAAYKAADLCSQLSKKEYDVNVIMTDSSLKFIGSKTFQTLSKNPVITNLWDVEDWKPEHIALADKVAIFAIIPATANFIAKYANGIADDALSTYALSHTGKVLIAPAMNPRMWSHPATQANVSILKERNVNFIGPDFGIVACGDSGKGRMSNVNEILSEIEKLLINV